MFRFTVGCCCGNEESPQCIVPCVPSACSLIYEGWSQNFSYPEWLHCDSDNGDYHYFKVEKNLNNLKFFAKPTEFYSLSSICRMCCDKYVISPLGFTFNRTIYGTSETFYRGGIGRYQCDGLYHGSLIYYVVHCLPYKMSQYPFCFDVEKDTKTNWLNAEYVELVGAESYDDFYYTPEDCNLQERTCDAGDVTVIDAKELDSVLSGKVSSAIEGLTYTACTLVGFESRSPQNYINYSATNPVMPLQFYIGYATIDGVKQYVVCEDLLFPGLTKSVTNSLIPDDKIHIGDNPDPYFNNNNNLKKASLAPMDLWTHTSPSVEGSGKTECAIILGDDRNIPDTWVYMDGDSVVKGSYEDKTGILNQRFSGIYYVYAILRDCHNMTQRTTDMSNTFEDTDITVLKGSSYMSLGYFDIPSMQGYDDGQGAWTQTFNIDNIRYAKADLTSFNCTNGLPSGLVDVSEMFRYGKNIKKFAWCISNFSVNIANGVELIKNTNNLFGNVQTPADSIVTFVDPIYITGNSQGGMILDRSDISGYNNGVKVISGNDYIIRNNYLLCPNVGSSLANWLFGNNPSLYISHNAVHTFAENIKNNSRYRAYPEKLLIRIAFDYILIY